MQVNSQVKISAIDHPHAGEAGVVMVSEVVDGVEWCNVKMDATSSADGYSLHVLATDLQFLG